MHKAREPSLSNLILNILSAHDNLVSCARAFFAEICVGKPCCRMATAKIFRLLSTKYHALKMLNCHMRRVNKGLGLTETLRQASYREVFLIRYKRIL